MINPMTLMNPISNKKKTTSHEGNLPGAVVSVGAFKAAPQRLQNFNRSLASAPHVGQYMIASTFQARRSARRIVIHKITRPLACP